MGIGVMRSGGLQSYREDTPLINQIINPPNVNKKVHFNRSKHTTF